MTEVVDFRVDEKFQYRNFSIEDQSIVDYPTHFWNLVADVIQDFSNLWYVTPSHVANHDINVTACQWQADSVWAEKRNICCWQKRRNKENYELVSWQFVVIQIVALYWNSINEFCESIVPDGFHQLFIKILSELFFLCFLFFCEFSLSAGGVLCSREVVGWLSLLRIQLFSDLFLHSIIR